MMTGEALPPLISFALRAEEMEDGLEIFVDHSQINKFQVESLYMYKMLCSLFTILINLSLTILLSL